MRKFLLTLFLTSLTMPFAANAEEVKDYVPLLQEGKVWKYVGAKGFHYDHAEVWFMDIELKVGSEVELDGQRYHECTIHFSDARHPIELTDYVIYLREDTESHQVWYNRLDTNDFILLMWFDIGAHFEDPNNVLIYDFNDMTNSESFYDTEGNPLVEDPTFIEGVGYAPKTSDIDLWKSESAYRCGSLLCFYYPVGIPGNAFGPFTYLYEVVDANGSVIYHDSHVAAYKNCIQITYFDAVDGVDADEDEAQAEWYNLQGVKVENPGQGMYIRRQGNSVSKVMVK